MLKRLVVLIFVMGVIAGCDSQSPEARFIDGLMVTLAHSEHTLEPWMFDLWSVSPDEEGRTIYSAAHGYKVKASIAGIPVAAIRIDAYILECIDPWYSDHRACIWCKRAPNGEYYGFVIGQPEATWDWDEQHAAVRTNPSGDALFFFGCGDPEIGTDAGWIWPTTASSVITTILKVNFVLRRAGVANISKEVHMYFVRAQHQNFWEPLGGVIGNSASLLIPFDPLLSLEAGQEEQEYEGSRHQKGEIQFESIDKRLSPKEYLAGAFREKGGIAAMSDGDSWEYAGGLWWQLVWDSAAGWILVQPDMLKVLLSPDPNIPGDAEGMLAVCEPYLFECAIFLEEEWVWDAQARDHTVIIESKTAQGDIVSRQPIQMWAYDYDGSLIYMMSEYVVPVDHKSGEGRWCDETGWFATFIHMVEGGYLELKVDDFYGDFNFDGFVDFKDFALFANQWRMDLFRPEFDLMYDATRDGQVKADDLAAFAENWLNEREPVL